MSATQEVVKKSIHDCMPNGVKGSQYSPEDRLQAATLYVISGNMRKVSQETGIAEGTLSEWKNKSEWWQELVEVIRTEKSDIIDAGYQEIVIKGVAAQIDRIDNGDYVQDKEGIISRVPVKLRDLTVATGIGLDKLRLIRNMPTSISSNASTESRLNQLAEQMVALVEQNKPVSTVERVENSEVMAEVIEKDE